MFVVPGDRRPQSHFYPFAHRASGGKAEEIQFQPSEGHDARTIELRPLAGILHDAFRAILIGERIHNWFSPGFMTPILGHPLLRHPQIP